MAFSYGLAMRYKYYAAISEITFSIAWMALLVGWLTRPAARMPDSNRWVHWGVAALMLIPLYISHPIIVIPLLVFLGFDILYNNKWKDWQNWGFTAFLLLVYVIKFFSVQKDPYEASRMEVIGTNKITEILVSMNDFYVYHIIKRYFDTEYTFPFVVFLLVVGFLFYKGKYLAAIFILLANAAWLVLNLNIYSYLKNDVFIMIDGYLALMAIIWATPMFFTLFRTRFRTAGLLLIVSLTLFSLHRIYKKHVFFTERLALVEEALDNNVTEEDRKFIIDHKYFGWEKMWYPYGLPHESLLISSLKGPDRTAIFYVNYDYRPLEPMLEVTDSFHQYHETVSIDRLPKKYFQLPKNKYKVTENVNWNQ